VPVNFHVSWFFRFKADHGVASLRLNTLHRELQMRYRADLAGDVLACIKTSRLQIEFSFVKSVNSRFQDGISVLASHPVE